LPDGTGIADITLTGSDRAASVTGLANGLTYTCTLTATNGAGTSPAATKKVAVRTVPSFPSLVSVTPGDRVLTLAWTAPPDDGGAAILGYVAACTSGAVTRTAKLVGAPVDGSVHLTGVLKSVIPGSTYTCTIAARNAAGTGPASAPVTVTADGKPGAPMLKLVAGSGSFTVQITPSAMTGPSPTLGYAFSCGIGGLINGVPTAFPVTLTDLAPFTVTGLTPGEPVTCTVTATNAVGTSATASRTVTPMA